MIGAKTSKKLMALIAVFTVLVSCNDLMAPRQRRAQGGASPAHRTPVARPLNFAPVHFDTPGDAEEALAQAMQPVIAANALCEKFIGRNITVDQLDSLFQTLSPLSAEYFQNLGNVFLGYVAFLDLNGQGHEWQREAALLAACLRNIKNVCVKACNIAQNQRLVELGGRCEHLLRQVLGTTAEACQPDYRFILALAQASDYSSSEPSPGGSNEGSDGTPDSDARLPGVGAANFGGRHRGRAVDYEFPDPGPVHGYFFGGEEPQQGQPWGTMQFGDFGVYLGGHTPRPEPLTVNWSGATDLPGVIGALKPYVGSPAPLPNADPEQQWTVKFPQFHSRDLALRLLKIDFVILVCEHNAKLKGILDYPSINEAELSDWLDERAAIDRLFFGLALSTLQQSPDGTFDPELHRILADQGPTSPCVALAAVGPSLEALKGQFGGAELKEIIAGAVKCSSDYLYMQRHPECLVGDLNSNNY